MATVRRLLLTSMFAGLIAALTPGAVAAAGPDPVLLVHGYRGSPGTWGDMKAFLESHGRTVVAIDLPGEDNVANAKAIANRLKQLRWRSVDLVGQSMGGLSARWFAKYVKSSVKVDAYVSIGTPQYGISSACILPYTYGGQMCPSSSFMRDLNAGDDTPGNAAWMTIYSTDDELVPNSASRLDGGACFVQVSGPTHNTMDNDATVMARTLAGIDGSCPGGDFRT
jgi:triacylglycerol lipase